MDQESFQNQESSYEEEFQISEKRTYKKRENDYEGSIQPLIKTIPLKEK